VTLSTARFSKSPKGLKLNRHRTRNAPSVMDGGSLAVTQDVAASTSCVRLAIHPPACHSALLAIPRRPHPPRCMHSNPLDRNPQTRQGKGSADRDASGSFTNPQPLTDDLSSMCLSCRYIKRKTDGTWHLLPCPRFLVPSLQPPPSLTYSSSPTCLLS
jgi:hypothetical protein